jgi:DNA-binding transcriptional ArsR family regulator
MEPLVALLKSLADENRVRALWALKQGELCVCQITELLDLAPSTVSKHMSVLKSAGLVRSRKDGRWIHYRLTEDGVARPALEWLFAVLSTDGKARDDRKRLKAVLACDPEELCKKQCRRC